jgi:hypothetical protein
MAVNLVPRMVVWLAQRKVVQKAVSWVASMARQKVVNLALHSVDPKAEQLDSYWVETRAGH